MDLIFVLLLLICAALLITGKPLNINITHTHKVEETKNIEAPTPQEQDLNEDIKDISETLQTFWGIINEE